MFRKFKFEDEIYEGMAEIPTSTRFKLDRVGLGLSLRVWKLLSEEEKKVLCHLPIRSQGEMDCYRGYLTLLLRRLKEQAETLDPALGARERAQWEDLARIPREIYLRALQADVIITPADWIGLDDLERYCLLKFCGEGKGAGRFESALFEFLGQPASRAATS